MDNENINNGQTQNNGMVAANTEEIVVNTADNNKIKIADEVVAVIAGKLLQKCKVYLICQAVSQVVLVKY